MNEATGVGIDVALELPRVLREFAVECRRQKVGSKDHLYDVATRHFAKLAGYSVKGESKAQKIGLVAPPVAAPVVAPPAEVVQPPPFAQAPRDEGPEPTLGLDPIQGLADVPNPYGPSHGPSQDEAAVRIQKVQKGRIARKDERLKERNALCMQAKVKVMPHAREIRLEGGEYTAVVFHEVEPLKVVFAVKRIATGRVYASDLTMSNLPPLIPQHHTYTSFWKGIASAEPPAISFSPDPYPSPSITISLPLRTKSSQELTSAVTIPLADLGDNDVSKPYFEDPFM